MHFAFSCGHSAIDSLAMPWGVARCGQEVGEIYEEEDEEEEEEEEEQEEGE